MVLKQSSNDRLNGVIFSISYFTSLPFRLDFFDANKKFYQGVVLGLPIVGIILATLTILIYTILPYHPLYNALLSSLFYVATTGFLHFEAVADTIDGWYASFGKKDIYDVMHEPQIGAIGTMGVVTFYILELSALVYNLYLENFFLILIALALSRVSIYFALKFDFHSKSYFVNSLKENIDRVKIVDILLLPLNMIAKYILGKLKNRLGFLNGDTLGFLIVVVEIIILNIGLLLF